jgi:hypothetical protein
MTAELRSVASLYETDFVAWSEKVAQLVRDRAFEQVDWENVIAEIESLGRSECHALENNLVVLLMHLLKWQYQPEWRSGSWRGSIREHRRRIRNALKDSPSLKLYLEQMFAECYQDAVEQAIDETGFPLAHGEFEVL